MSEIKQREVSESSWWKEAIAGLDPRIVIEFPQAGYFKRKLVKGGPFVPCRIWLVEHIEVETGDYMADTDYHCEVDGVPKDAFDQWSYLANYPIKKDEYDFMKADAAYVRDHSPDDPKAMPQAAVDFFTAPPPF